GLGDLPFSRGGGASCTRVAIPSGGAPRAACYTRVEGALRFSKMPWRKRMSGLLKFMRAGVMGAALAGLLASSAFAQMELKIMAPAAPGGGWDQTARSMQQALVAEKIARSVQVTNVAGAGGTVGIAQFVNGAKGDGNQLMVSGFVMVGAI